MSTQCSAGQDQKIIDGNPLALLDETPPREEPPPPIDEVALSRLAEDGCPVVD